MNAGVCIYFVIYVSVFVCVLCVCMVCDLLSSSGIPLYMYM
jgi:hypothetical protein